MIPIRWITTWFQPPRIAPSPRRRIGVSTGIGQITIDTMKKLGLTECRTTIVWNNYLDPRKFADDQATLDDSGKTIADWFDVEIQAYLASSIDPLTVVHTPPNGMTFATGLSAAPAFMVSLVNKYPGRTWQFMNEMDASSEFSGGPGIDWFGGDNHALTQNQRGDLYGQMLGPVYDAMKTADPSCTVIAGGIALDPATFYAGLVARAPGKYDAIAVHNYGPPMNGVFRDKSINMRAVIGSTPLWCTEFGTNLSSDVDQAADIGAALADNDANHRYERAYLYRLMGDPPFDVVHDDGTLRHAAMLLVERPTA